MKMPSRRFVAALTLFTFLLYPSSAELAEGQSQREKLLKTMKDGNYKDAYEGLRKLALDPQNDRLLVGEDLHRAIECLQRLNRVSEIDAFLEAVIEMHKENWRLLWAAAQSYMSVPHHGFLVAGEFQRGDHRGGGDLVNAAERDRIRALQLMAQALPKAHQDSDRALVGNYLLSFARMLLNNRGHGEAWRLQYLSDLSTLPDYQPGWGYRRETEGAPVDTEGKPVFHKLPDGFEAAKTDGERWRWCLQEAMEASSALKSTARLEFADFLWGQLDVHTLAYYGWRFGRMQDDDTRKDESGTYALHTLGEDETIARLAIGARRFRLPDEFNYMKIYRELADADDRSSGWQAINRLATIFENRRQYPKAVETLRKAIDDHPSFRPNLKDRVDQIVANWGRFEPTSSEPAGRGATVEFRFRNGKSVEFSARAVKVEKLLEDVKAYIKGRPKRIDYNQINIGDIGYRFVRENQEQYLGDEVARWKMDLEPRPAHFDRRITVTTPLQKAGAYFLTAKMDGGNASHIILWVADTVIVKKPLSGRTFYFVADAVTGKPVAKANVEFFGFNQKWQDGNRVDIEVRQFAEFTDPDGQLVPDPSDQPDGHQWLITARTKEGRFAYLGFTGVWYPQYYDQEYEAVKAFAITDRPVYRPMQAAKYKFWVRRAKYDLGDTSEFAGQTFTVELHDPKGEKISEESKRADAYGGLEGEWKLAADAALGVYAVTLRQGDSGLGSGSFRVEEYKKPEFEVTVEAPTEPVMLGEKVAAKIQAKYYFGSPVTQAKVKYKVLRTGFSQRWYPVRPWDWLYGPGYWWFAYDYDWYPGFRVWGCRSPLPFWWNEGREPPEVVADGEVEIGGDGTVKVEIDTGLAKAIHPDEDHRYAITAEVVDASRRTIVGAGEVLVARSPFKVYAWVDRGYYRVGDTVEASFSARKADSKPVQGKGELTLLKITYKDGDPVETAVGTWKVDTNVEGEARQKVAASQAGQYRLSYKLTDSKGHTLEGGYLFTVIGEGFDGSQFRFNHLELVPEKGEYAPGEKMKLQVNTDRAGGTVLLFLRPANGVYLPPKVLRLSGKSALEEIQVIAKDMPNFFVEALTVADGRVHSELREIVVPPEKRVLNVGIVPSSASYRPGQSAKVGIQLTDLSGEPFVGSTVVAIYDKSVEYVSGGSNVPAIKEFFWKWRRHHFPQAEHSLLRYSVNMIPKGAKGMRDVGVFGATVAEEMDGMEMQQVGFGQGSGRGGMAKKSQVARSEVFDGDMLGIPMAPVAAATEMSSLNAARKADSEAKGGPGGGETEVQPTVRKEFADTALWVAALETAKDGTAEVELKMPENLTTWRIKVWGLGHGTRVGEGATDVVTRKDLILRMQAPRFFVEKDEVVLSANVHNYLPSAKSVRLVLELEGKTLSPLGAPEQKAMVEPQGEARVDWRVRVASEGEAVVRMKAITDEESDAMEMRFPAYVHGMVKVDSFSGAIRPADSSGKFTIRVPAERRPEQSRVEVRYSPTLAGAMVDALPYLVDYPYGCTEQTLNRFLPTVITQKVLMDMGLNLAEIREKRTNLNAQEIGDDRERAARWKRYDRNPVFDEDEVARMVKAGVKRLTEMQCSDGGWGWFSGWGEHSSPHTTALVVHGLQIAAGNGVALVPAVLERGVAWLKRYQEEEVQELENALKEPKVRPWKDSADDLDAFAYMVLVDAEDKGEAGTKMRDFLYRDRTHLAVYTLAMYGIALEKQGEREKLEMVIGNISQFLVTDDENQTAWLNLPGGRWWYWHGSEYEAHAYYLKLLARVDPKGEVAPRLVKYLLNNRKNATYWNSTRDTALCVEAMADFLRSSGETKPEMTVEVWLDGKLQKAVEITPANLFGFDNRFVLEGEAVTTGEHVIELRRQGKGPLYFNGYLTYFSLEDFIAKAGLEVKVERRYYRLERADKVEKAAGSRGQAVDQRVEKYDRKPIANLSAVKSGDLVEIELVIESKNDYEYLVFEDMKAAGFEPVDLRSGYNGNALGAYMEFRDNRVVFFVRELARGKHSVAYRVRAEIPGKFSALPTRGWAMYAPELKGNSDEIKVVVEDAK